MTESFDAAESLARVLKSLRRDRAHQGLEEKQATDADQRWQAASFLAGVLQRAHPRQPMTRQVAEDAIENHRQQLRDSSRATEAQELASIADLESAFLVRVVAGELRVPDAISMGRGRGTQDQLPEGQRLALNVLVEKRHAADREKEFWIQNTTLLERREAHARVYPGTPTVDELVSAGTFQNELRGQAIGFSFPSRAPGLWVHLGSRILALSWPDLPAFPTPEASRKAMLDWLALASDATNWPDAVAFMGDTARKTFLDAATVFLLHEPDLQGWDDEGKRLHRESQYEAFRSEFSLRVPPVAPNSPLTRFDWRERQSHQDWWDSARATLGGLLRSIVTYDDEVGGYEQRYGRIRRLLLAGADRPWLSWEVPDQISSNRPDAIAWLLTHADTSALGFRLIERLDMNVSRWSLTAREATRKQEEKRNVIWADAWRILAPLVREHPDENAAIAVGDVLLMASRAIDQRHWQGNESEVRDLREARYELTWAALESIQLRSIRRRKSVVGFEDTRPILPSLADSLTSRFSRDVQQLRDVSGPAFPVAEMRILFHLQSLLSAWEGQADLPKSLPTAVSVARALAAAYSGELKKTVFPPVPPPGGHQEDVTWRGSHPEVAGLPWGDAAVVLYRTGNHEELLAPFDMGDSISQVPSLAVTISEQQELSTHPKSIVHGSRQDTQRFLEYSLSNSWVNKLQLHLRILLNIDEALRERRLRIATNDAEREKFRGTIDARIIELLQRYTRLDLRQGLVQLFPEGVRPAHEVNASALLHDSSQAISLFAPELRARGLRAWLEQVTDARIVLECANAVSALEGRALALRRLAALKSDQMFDDVEDLRTLVAAAENAAKLGEFEVARQALHTGDTTASDPRRKAYWEYWAYTPRLLIAYLQNDRSAMAALQIPSVPPNPLQGDDEEKLQSAKTFYESLLMLNAEPDRAVQMMNEALRDRPNAWSVALNRFAARLRVAGQKADEERRAIAQEALAEWDHEVAPKLSGEARESLEFYIHYNRLTALRYGGRYADVDAIRNGMSARQRTELSMLRLIAETLIEQGRADELTTLFAEAEARHRASDGTLPLELENLEKELHKNAPDMTTAAGLPVQADRALTVREHRSNWHEILRLPSEQLVKTISGSQFTDPVAGFLLQRHVEVAKVLLDRVSSIGAIKDENKYNDLFQCLLEARLGFLGWSVPDQSRGGSSDGDESKAGSAGVGERDWAVKTNQGSRLAVIEALRLSSVDTAKIDRHLGKLRKYDPSSLARAFVVVYFEGADFAGFVSRYLQHLRTTSFGEWQRRDASMHQSDEFDNVGSVKVLRSEYEDSTNRNVVSVYHVLLQMPDALAV